MDAMPPGIQAVSDGKMLATVRNRSCRIHGYAILTGVAAVVSGEKTTASGTSGCRCTWWRRPRGDPAECPPNRVKILERGDSERRRHFV
jgi:hypothetical protein